MFLIIRKIYLFLFRTHVIKGYSFPYFPYLSGIMKIKTALYSLFSRLDWYKTVVFACLGGIYEGIRSLSWEIPVA